METEAIEPKAQRQLIDVFLATTAAVDNLYWRFIAFVFNGVTAIVVVVAVEQLH